MSLPRAVQAQVDEADRLLAAMRAELPSVEDDSPAENEQPQAPAEDVVEEPVSQPVEPVSASEPSWEHKYKSEVGRFKAETERAREAAQNAWSQIEALKAELAALKAPKEPVELEPPPVPGVTDQDIETFGSDLVSFTERAARKAVADAQKVWEAKSQALLKVIEELRGQVGNTTEQAYYRELAREVSDWETVNNDPAFHAWLQEEEGLTGYPRQAFLQQAHQAQNAPRVAKIFQAFKATLQPVPKAQSPELQRQVSPPKSRTGSTTPDTSGKKVWSQDEIVTFYENKIRNRYDPTEAARIERDIDIAVAEGRVR